MNQAQKCLYVFIPYHQLLCSMVDLVFWTGDNWLEENCAELPFFQERSGHVICLFIKSGSQSPREKARWSHGKKRICTLEKYFKLSKPKRKKKQDVQNYVMLSNSPTVDSKISKIRSDVQNSSAAEDTLQKYMSTFFHFKSICCIMTEASSPF